MSARARSVIVCAAQLGLLLAVGGRHLLDRWRYPRGWARTVAFDPDLPIRGRYLALAVETAAADDALSSQVWAPTVLEVAGDRLVAHRRTSADDYFFHMAMRGSTPGRVRLSDRLAFFIPEHADDPTRRPPGEELWLEATVAPRGPLRPIRLGVMRDGVITPLD